MMKLEETATVEFEQLTLIKDDDRIRKQINEKHAVKRALHLRERAISDGMFDNLDVRESIAAILSNARGTTDPFELADRLIDEFGSLKGVLEARPEQLAKVEGMNAARVNQIAFIKPICKLWELAMMDIPVKIQNSREAENYCLSILAGERNEKFYVISLNAQCKVLGRRQISEGSLTECSAYPRMVTETALNYNAHSVLFSHNHPGGTCAPSPEDVSSTVMLQKILNSLNILVLDHIIVAGDRTYSMIQHGDIDYRLRKGI